ncbi:MAG: hypothetical protein Q9178_001405 [Gyalolechia marmorata]
MMEKPNMKPLVKRQEPAPQAGEQVTIYQNGELLDPEYAGLFNCKLADASPPTPPSPPPPAPSAVRETIFDIGYFQTEEPGELQGAVIFRFEAAVFAGNAAVDERIACNNRPTYRDAEFTIGGRPGFPQQIKFDAAGRKGCEFNRGGDSDAGGLTCDGVLAKCSKEDGDPEPIKCKDEGGKTTETWRTQITSTENLVPYSKSQPVIFKSGQLSPVKDLKLLVKDYAPIAKSALTILINISVDPEILKSLAEDDVFLESILNRITNPKETNATLLSMLLSNLAKSDSFARLLNTKRPTVRTLSSTATNAFDQLLDLFNRGVSGSYNPNSKFEYLPYLFADLAKFPSISSQLIATSSPNDAPMLTTFTPHTSPSSLPLPVRLGATSTIRNALLSIPSPLTTIPTLIPHIIPSLLLPLIGSDPAFSESETEMLPPELRLLGPEHKQENDLQVLNNLVESLFLICARGEEKARKGVRDMGAYAVVREVHVGVEDEGIRENVERVVQLLIEDEAELGEREGEPNSQKGDDERRLGRHGMREEETDDEDDKIVEIF